MVISIQMNVNNGSPPLLNHHHTYRIGVNVVDLASPVARAEDFVTGFNMSSTGRKTLVCVSGSRESPGRVTAWGPS